MREPRCASQTCFTSPLEREKEGERETVRRGGKAAFLSRWLVAGSSRRLDLKHVRVQAGEPGRCDPHIDDLMLHGSLHDVNAI